MNQSDLPSGFGLAWIFACPTLDLVVQSLICVVRTALLASWAQASHRYVNDLIWRALQHAGIPSTKEPTGLSRLDDKRPDGLTLIPWQAGKNLIWAVTMANARAASHLATTSRVIGGAAETAADMKTPSIASWPKSWPKSYIFRLRNHGTTQFSSCVVCCWSGRRCFSNPSESSFLFQQLSVVMQRFNCVCLKIVLLQHTMLMSSHSRVKYLHLLYHHRERSTVGNQNIK